ncbi:MAG: tail fiber domain-containing protein [Proteobacteria bacterium]|nr:tail fiber domain-containing protein [Pseudomonadota bacterium]NBP14865.1 tail fiber domain-containing protein [bacterium]
MASRDWLRHWSNNSEPPSPTLGDEWFDISRNRLFKRVALQSGYNVQWAQLVLIDQTGAALVTGNLYVTGDVVTNYSDSRLKTVVGPIENAVEKLKLIDTIYYRPNELAISLGQNDRLMVGVTAQSVKKVMPEVVRPVPNNEEYDTVQYERLVPLLIAAIKEQQVQIDELEKKLGVK